MSDEQVSPDPTSPDLHGALVEIRRSIESLAHRFRRAALSPSSLGPRVAAEAPFLALFPVSDAVAVPVRSGGSALGILYAGRRAPRPPFSEAEVLLLLVIADRVGNALGQRDAIETTRGHIGRLRELEVFLGHVLVGQDMEAVLARACEVACRLAEARVAAIGVPGGTGGLALAA